MKALIKPVQFLGNCEHCKHITHASDSTLVIDTDAEPCHTCYQTKHRTDGKTEPINFEKEG